jgi:hypothetical protein
VGAGRRSLVSFSSFAKTTGIFDLIEFFGKIEMDLPLIGTYPESEKPDAGIHPDIVVEQTAEDIPAGRDRAMEKVAALLKVK